jgi:hypothetical protein
MQLASQRKWRIGGGWMAELVTIPGHFIFPINRAGNYKNIVNALLTIALNKAYFAAGHGVIYEMRHLSLNRNILYGNVKELES